MERADIWRVNPAIRALEDGEITVPGLVDQKKKECANADRLDQIH